MLHQPLPHCQFPFSQLLMSLQAMASAMTKTVTASTKTTAGILLRTTVPPDNNTCMIGEYLLSQHCPISFLVVSHFITIPFPLLFSLVPLSICQLSFFVLVLSLSFPQLLFVIICAKGCSLILSLLFVCLLNQDTNQSQHQFKC